MVTTLEMTIAYTKWKKTLIRGQYSYVKKYDTNSLKNTLENATDVNLPFVIPSTFTRRQIAMHFEFLANIKNRFGKIFKFQFDSVMQKYVKYRCELMHFTPTPIILHLKRARQL